jgi:enamine deaminase RidA (YjgF/YER057c/UK114 family)
MNLPDGVAATRFRGANGCEECFLSVEPPRASLLSFAAQLECVDDLYSRSADALNLSSESAVFRRIFVSDVLNQAYLVRESALADGRDESPVAVSIVQQPPSGGAKIALLAYHVSAPETIAKRRLSRNHVLIEHSGTRHLWSTRLCAGRETAPADSAAQTRLIFEALGATLAEQGANLERHCQRTWIYLKDVDVFYRDMVTSRSGFFAKQGLTAQTHYIASTGIEGACAHQFDVVSMDAYSNLDTKPEQVFYLNDFEHMCATKDYSVTFERGTRLAYADRRHYYISGTASIDRVGKVMYRGDVLAQLDRALENVDALLHSGDAAVADMRYWIVYLRDRSDFEAVQRRLSDRFPDVPTVYVQGPVCRPEWLIEVEGIAVNANNQSALPQF